MSLTWLLKEKLKSKNNEVLFNYDQYWKAIKSICKDIKNKYDITGENIGILGIARGGLPMLVSISHELGIRNISMVQIQMSNSDNCHDYGEVRLISECINDNIEQFIVLEDIIYKGKTTDATISLLKNRNKKVLGVYSLILDEGFKDISIKNKEVDINYAYELNEDDWVYFLWEKDIEEGKVNE